MFRTNPFIAELLSIVLAAFFAVLTVAFVTVPYALERHPWEHGATSVAVAVGNSHLT